MNKVILALTFGVLLVIAYIAGFTVGAFTAWAIGFGDIGTGLIASFVGAAFAGEFAISIGNI